MDFTQSVKTCFRKYFIFKGRASRSEFWWFQLFLIILEIGLTTMDHLLLGFTWDSNATPLATILDFLTVAPLAAVTTRRLHDIGRSGWWQAPMYLAYLFYLDIFIPHFSDGGFMGVALMVSGLYLLALLLVLIRDGDSKANKYGPNPKSEGVSEVFS